MATPDYVPKHNVPARLTLTDGSQLLGTIYVRQGQRILEMLCDQRAFFPLKSKTGVSLISKRSVVKVDVVSLEDVADKEDLYPDLDIKYLSANPW